MISNTTTSTMITRKYKIPQRKMGSQGLECSIQGLGTMGFTAFYDITGSDDEENIRILGESMKMGMNMIDTAFLYMNFQTGESSEAIVGKALERYGRENFIVCTKCGIEITQAGINVSGKEDLIRKQLDESLRRLNTNYIDLYYIHRIDASTPIEETMEVFKKLHKEGKIKYAGLSECTPEELERAHKVFPITAIQMEWSIVSREIEESVLLTARKLGVAIVAYSPLGRGLLSKTFTKREDITANDYRTQIPRFDEENFNHNNNIVDKLEQYALRKGYTVGQLALAWVHNQGEDVFPIPGTKRMSRLYENAHSAFIKLTNEEMLEMEEIVKGFKGERYNEFHMMGTFQGRMKK